MGDSMNLAKVKGKNITDGSYAVIKQNDKDFATKDIVAANIDGTLTLKELRKLDKKTIGLFPNSTNQEHKPIYLSKRDDFLIIGKATDIYKG